MTFSQWVQAARQRVIWLESGRIGAGSRLGVTDECVGVGLEIRLWDGLELEGWSCAHQSVGPGATTTELVRDQHG